ncbi:hypothetical protein N8Z33_02410 [Flavobacteriaceae bacterium]|nr:hypothetical protein [Flavobacteriaceae bacterium]
MRPTHFLFLTALCVCCCFVDLQAQQTQDSVVVALPKIVVLGRAQKEKKAMYLRWAVTTPSAWRKSNIHGIDLVRYTISRDGKTLISPEEVHLGLFVPEPLEQWRNIVEINDNAAVMAQALYGEQFNVEGVNALSAIVNLAEEQEQRFTWALHAADQDFSVAQKAGLGYIDQTVKPNEKYLYKLTSRVPATEIIIEEGGVILDIENFEFLPKPLGLSAIFLDQKALLSWNYALLSQTYNSYFVERSEDGIQFDRLNDLPLSPLNNNDSTNEKRMFYIDSIQNNHKYFYRIQGITPFEEYSPNSTVVSGTSKAVLAYVPRIKTKTLLSETQVEMEWEFLEEGNAFISHFDLNQSDQVDGLYKTVRTNIPPLKRKIIYDGLLPTNYFTLTAVGKNGNSRTSFPVLVQPVDSTPPVKPTKLIGQIDSLGVVSLSWKNNEEKDLLGYRVFKGNFASEEFSQITIAPHQGNQYYDSIALKNLNPKVFYHIVAVDQRFNSSERSDVLELIKPDLVPPAQAVFTGYYIESNTVSLSWALSSSSDVSRHEVYRKSEGDEEWEMVYTVVSEAVSSRQEAVSSGQEAVGSRQEAVGGKWIDTSVEAGQQYSYTVIAVDTSGLESIPVAPLNISIPKSATKPKIDKFKSNVDRENGKASFSWAPYTNSQASEIIVYRGISEQPITLYKTLQPEISSFVETKLKPNNSYHYLFRVVFKDGSLSEILEYTLNY